MQPAINFKDYNIAKMSAQTMMRNPVREHRWFKAFIYFNRAKARFEVHPVPKDGVADLVFIDELP